MPNNDASPDLRYTKVKQSLIWPKALLGGDEKISMFNLLVTFNMVMALNVYLYIFVGIAIQAVLVFMHKKDPFMRDIYLRYIKFHHRYDPWLRKNYQRNRRFVEFQEY
jgi:type IV secretory pathway TrbD component